MAEVNDELYSVPFAGNVCHRVDGENGEIQIETVVKDEDLQHIGKKISDDMEDIKRILHDLILRQTNEPYKTYKNYILTILKLCIKENWYYKTKVNYIIHRICFALLRIIDIMNIACIDFNYSNIFFTYKGNYYIFNHDTASQLRHTDVVITEYPSSYEILYKGQNFIDIDDLLLATIDFYIILLDSNGINIPNIIIKFLDKFFKLSQRYLTYNLYFLKSLFCFLFIVIGTYAPGNESYMLIINKFIKLLNFIKDRLDPTILFIEDFIDPLIGFLQGNMKQHRDILIYILISDSRIDEVDSLKFRYNIPLFIKHLGEEYSTAAKFEQTPYMHDFYNNHFLVPFLNFFMLFDQLRSDVEETCITLKHLTNEQITQLKQTEYKEFLNNNLNRASLQNFTIDCQEYRCQAPEATGAPGAAQAVVIESELEKIYRKKLKQYSYLESHLRDSINKDGPDLNFTIYHCKPPQAQPGQAQPTQGPCINIVFHFDRNDENLTIPDEIRNKVEQLYRHPKRISPESLAHRPASGAASAEQASAEQPSASGAKKSAKGGGVSTKVQLTGNHFLNKHSIKKHKYKRNIKTLKKNKREKVEK